MATTKTTKKASTKKSAAKKAPAKKAAAKKTSAKSAGKKPAAAKAKAQPGKATFHLYDEGKKAFVPVPDGREVRFKGFGTFQFFLHKPADGKGWSVSEAASGARIAVGKTQKEAKAEAERLLAQNGPDGLRTGIARAIKKNGAAPGCTGPEPAKATKKEKKPATGNRGRKPKGEISQLDAAVVVLKDAKGPLTCKEIVLRMFEKKIWNTSGRTPGATLSASMQREIAKRGKESRFRKAERGLYELNR